MRILPSQVLASAADKENVEAAHHPWPALGALLLRDGLVDADELEAVLAVQEDGGHHRISARRLGELLVERGTVTHAQVAQLLAEQYELPYLELGESDVNLRAAALLTEEQARSYSALPISVLPDASVLVAVSDPPLVLFSDEFRRLLGVPLRYAVAAQDRLDGAIAHAAARASEAAAAAANLANLVVLDPELDDIEGYLETPAEPEVTVELPEHPRAHRSAALGALLVRDGLIGERELEAALAQQRITGNKRLGEILVERGDVTRAQVAKLVAEQYDLPFLEVEPLRIQLVAAALLPGPVARRLSALPLGFAEDGSLLVVVSDPTNVVYADELRDVLEAPIRFAVAAPDEIEAALNYVARRTEAAEEDVDVEPSAEEPRPVEVEEVEEVEDEEDAVHDELRLDEALLAELEEPPADADDGPDDVVVAEPDEAVAVVVAVEDEPAPPEVVAREEDVQDTSDLDEVIQRGLSLGAVTIQLSPQPRGLVVRGRVDRVMRELAVLPASGQEESTRRLARHAGLGSSENGPRQGLLALATDEGTVDLRVTSIPTKLGVQVTLRVPDPEAEPDSLAELGLSSKAEAVVRDALRAPNGAFLACGSVASGRTTTLYAALRELATPERAVATIEDPVERLTPGIDQVEVDPAAGVSFARGLRAILRTAPDVVLVGDLADGETARVAFGAARAERVVLAALEAPTAAASLGRLRELGVDARTLSATLSCLVAQHLVRRICTDCRETYYASAEDIAELGRPDEESGRRLLARGPGCPACGGSGFRGWASVFEALPLTDELRGLVVDGADRTDIHDAAVAAGMSTMWDEAVGLCLDGVTTVAEVLQVPRG
jgi:type IV pilus assembly protein PilB